MDELRSLIDQVLQPSKRRDPREFRARAAVIARLFAAYRDHDQELMKHYAMVTADIPLTFLASAIIVIERSRVYPTLPATGDIWTTARKIARMDREQLNTNGHYQPPPRSWPPEGKQHGIGTGTFNDLPKTQELLDSGIMGLLLESAT